MKENGYIGNTNALKYKTQEQLQEGIDAYFKMCDEKDKPYTMSGLALALGIDRATLVRYGDKDLFANQIKEAKAKVEAMLEENLYRLGNNSGIIFNLKNNYGWKDVIENKNTTEICKVDELLKEIKEEANK